MQYETARNGESGRQSDTPNMPCGLLYNCPPKGRRRVVDMYQLSDAKSRQYVYLQ